MKKIWEAIKFWFIKRGSISPARTLRCWTYFLSQRKHAGEYYAAETQLFVARAAMAMAED